MPNETPSQTQTPSTPPQTPKWVAALGPDVQPPRANTPSGNLPPAPVPVGDQTPPTQPVPPVIQPPAPTGSPTPPATQTPAAPATPSGPAPVQLSPEMLQQLVTGVASAVAPTAQPQAPTQEQLDKMFNVHRVDAEALKAWGWENPSEAQVAAINAYGQAIAKQAASVAAFQLALARKELESVLSPIQQHFEEQRVKAAEDRFYTKYPGLKEYAPLVMQIGQAIASSGKTWQNEDAAFTDVVNETVRVLKSVGVDITSKLGTSGAQAPQPPNQPNPNGMPQLSAGGQGGAGGAPASGGNEPRWKKALAD